MGRDSRLEFFEVKLKKKSFERFRQSVEEMRGNETEEVSFAHMLPHLRIYLRFLQEHDGYLDWNLDRRARKYLTKSWGPAPRHLSGIDWPAVTSILLEMHGENDQFCDWGKWYFTEDLVKWLRRFCSGGRILQYSGEGDGDVEGWEFNRRGEVRELRLTPVSPWKRFE